MDYLRGVFGADVDTGTTVGFDDLIAKWKRLTELFSDIHTRLDGLTRIGTITVLAETITIITITEKALLAAFPHLVDGSNNGDGCRKQIVDKLLDQRIVVRGGVRFDRDKTHHRVDKLYTQMDMLSPILHLIRILI
ncbi:hypothetical protein PHMEG_00026878 [Phytophthora megakarya]|uniref:Uncharacterized protein n=1 Tax=Phytophthora megakarya TaxID=4795 RepID=A0A225V8H7_9STRA|nr:hypothetical protein PHMEG_00026877 [Phytophthora megakarya]OWZ01686.1 hypothetical protein PHMEG_00026878 [Phytophthora megakarya]